MSVMKAGKKLNKGQRRDSKASILERLGGNIANKGKRKGFIRCRTERNQNETNPVKTKGTSKRS